jgi:hypothetical protein
MPMNRLLCLLIACCALVGCHRTEPPKEVSTTNNKTPKKDVVVKIGELSSKVPDSWKDEKPASMDRIYQFKLPKSEGDPEDAEVVVLYLVSGSGTASANISRWKGLFEPPTGKTINDVSKTDKFQVGSANVTYLDLSGTFLSKGALGDLTAKTEKKADFRRIHVIFEIPGAPEPYFVTLTGPAKTVEHHKKSFDEWLKNFK